MHNIHEKLSAFDRRGSGRVMRIFEISQDVFFPRFVVIIISGASRTAKLENSNGRCLRIIIIIISGDQLCCAPSKHYRALFSKISLLFHRPAKLIKLIISRWHAELFTRSVCVRRPYTVRMILTMIEMFVSESTLLQVSSPHPPKTFDAMARKTLSDDRNNKRFRPPLPSHLLPHPM